MLKILPVILLFSCATTKPAGFQGGATARFIDTDGEPAIETLHVCLVRKGSQLDCITVEAFMSAVADQQRAKPMSEL